MRRSFTLVLFLVAAVTASTANASSVVSTSNVTHVTLGVNGKGEAMVTYVQDGKTVHVLAWGAENALPPTPGGKQVDFQYDYSGGYSKLKPGIEAALAALRALQTQMADATAKHDNRARYALAPKIAAANQKLIELRKGATDYFETFRCPRYTGPVVAFQVAACTAPDGSFWAVQQWQRNLPDYGVAPTPAQAAHEIHLSHWTGALPDLTVETDWSYHKWQHLFGTFTYDDHPVYGFKSTHGGKPLDTFGRNVYLDSFDADYGGGGWQRVNSWLTHKSTGAWCYGISPHGAKNLTGAGSKYRLTIMGPGVAPDVSVTVPSPGAYDATVDAQQNAKIAALHDNLCKPN